MDLFANVANTTVSSGGTTAPSPGTSQSWTVASSTAFPAAVTSTSQFRVVDVALPSEVMIVTNVSGTTWTVTRGAEGTTPVAHSAGFTVQHIVTAGALEEFGQVEAPNTWTGDQYFTSNRPWTDVIGLGADPTGVANSQSAIASAFASGAAVFLPPGTFQISTQLSVSTSSMTIKGAGMMLSTLRGPGATANVITVPSSGVVDDLEICDLTIDCNSPTSGHIITASAGHLNRLTLRRVRFINVGVSTAISSSYGANYVIEDCVWEGGGTCAANFFAGATNFESLIARRNKIRYFNTAFSIGQSSGANAEYVELIDNDLDGAWWTSAAVQSNSGGTVTYTATTLVDTSVTFGTYLSDQPVRVLSPQATGLVGSGTAGTMLSDTSATFLSDSLLRGHIVRSGTVFGVVANVISNTTLQVEEWLSQTTYLPVAQPATSAAYTVYGVMLGNIQSASSNTVTIGHGSSGGGGGWYSLTGAESTPSSGTLYEILPRGDYPVYMTPVTQKLQIIGNRIRRGWADQLELFGTRMIVTNNIIEDGNNYGIAVAPNSTVFKAVVANNIIRHNAFGMCVETGSDVEVGPNQYEDNGWGVPNAFKAWQLALINCQRVTVTGGNATNTGENTQTTCGLSLQGASLSACKVQGFTANGHLLADIYVQSNAAAGGCQLNDVSGVIAYQGTTNGQQLRITGTGAPTLPASPGSIFIRTDGGAGATLYDKASANDNTNWEAQPGATGGGGSNPIGSQTEYASTTSSLTGSVTASTWTQLGSLAITLPSDGYTYRVLLTGMCEGGSASADLYVGIGTGAASADIYAATLINQSSATFEAMNVTAQSVVGSGQTIGVYVYDTSTETVTLTAGGITSAKVELAAYRVK